MALGKLILFCLKCVQKTVTDSFFIQYVEFISDRWPRGRKRHNRYARTWTPHNKYIRAQNMLTIIICVPCITILCFTLDLRTMCSYSQWTSQQLHVHSLHPSRSLKLNQMSNSGLMRKSIKSVLKPNTELAGAAAAASAESSSCTATHPQNAFMQPITKRVATVLTALTESLLLHMPFRVFTENKLKNLKH